MPLRQLQKVVTIAPISKPFWQDIVAIDDEVNLDPVLPKIKEDLTKDLNLHHCYTLEHSRLLQRKIGVCSNISMDS